MDKATESAPARRGATHLQGMLMGALRFAHWMQRALRVGVQASMADAPRCHFSLLEPLHFAIQRRGRDGMIYVSELTTALNKPPPAVSRSLRLLEQDGLIERTVDPADRRKTVVRITPAGEKARRACEEATYRYMQGIFDRMDPACISRLKDDLMAVMSAIDAQNETLGIKAPSLDDCDFFPPAGPGTPPGNAP